MGSEITDLYNLPVFFAVDDDADGRFVELRVLCLLQLVVLSLLQRETHGEPETSTLRQRKGRAHHVIMSRDQEALGPGPSSSPVSPAKTKLTVN